MNQSFPQLLLAACIVPLLSIPNPLVGKDNQKDIHRIEFVDTPLSEAVAFFQARSAGLNPMGKGIKFTMDSKVDQKQLVSLRLNNVPAGTAFIYMVDQVGLDYRIGSRTCSIVPGGQGELAKRQPLKPGVTSNFLPAKMARQVVLENIEFNGANIDSVIKYIAERSEEKLGEKRGINLILSQRIDPEIPITIRMNYVPISGLLAIIAKITFLEIRIESHAIFLDPPGTKASKLVQVAKTQTATQPSSARRSRSGRNRKSSLGTIPNDPRSPAHPDYDSSNDRDVSKRTNALNNTYKWVNGKWTFVKHGSTGQGNRTRSLRPASLNPSK